jgi:hypothetical protein
MEEKKQWHKPQLIILGRGKPEEAVLGQCKNIAGGNNTPSSPQCRGIGGQEQGACHGLGQS